MKDQSASPYHSALVLSVVTDDVVDLEASPYYARLHAGRIARKRQAGEREGLSAASHVAVERRRCTSSRDNVGTRALGGVSPPRYTPATVHEP